MWLVPQSLSSSITCQRYEVVIAGIKIFFVDILCNGVVTNTSIPSMFIILIRVCKLFQGDFVFISLSGSSCADDQSF